MAEHAIVYIKRGCKMVMADGVEYKVARGELFMLPKGKYVMSEYIPGEGEDFQSIMLFFNQHLISDIIQLLGDRIPVQQIFDKEHLVQVIGNNAKIVRFYESFPDFTTESPFDKELLEIKIKELIYVLLSDNQSQRQIYSFLRHIYHLEGRSIAVVVNENLYNKTSLEALAMLCCMSVSTFKREFAKVFNASPIKWMNDKRLEKALLLVKNTSQPVGDIAYECGFENYTHFSRCFKDKYGKSANAIRADMQYV